MPRGRGRPRLSQSLVGTSTGRRRYKTEVEKLLESASSTVGSVAVMEDLGKRKRNEASNPVQSSSKPIPRGRGRGRPRLSQSVTGAAVAAGTRRKAELERPLDASSTVSEVVRQGPGKRKRIETPSEAQSPSPCRRRTRSESAPRSESRPRKLTEKRQARILEFMKRASEHPETYGVYASEKWMDQVIAYIDERNVYGLTHDHIKGWLKTNPVFNKAHWNLCKLKSKSKAPDNGDDRASAKPWPGHSRSKVMNPSKSTPAPPNLTAAPGTSTNPILIETRRPTVIILDDDDDDDDDIGPEPEPGPSRKQMTTSTSAPPTRTPEEDETPTAPITIPSEERDEAEATPGPEPVSDEAVVVPDPDASAGGTCPTSGNGSGIPTPELMAILMNMETGSGQAGEDEDEEIDVVGLDDDESTLPPPPPPPPVVPTRPRTLTEEEYQVRIKNNCIAIMDDVNALRRVHHRNTAGPAQHVRGLHMALVQSMAYSLSVVVNGTGVD